MDTAFTIKAPTSVAAIEPARPVMPLASVVPTELPPAKTVTPAPNALALRNDANIAQTASTHDVVLDPESREIIFRVLDAKSRQVLWQVPDQAMLRLRAYARALDTNEHADVPTAHADVQA